MTTARRWAETGLFVVAVGCLVVGGLLALTGQRAVGDESSCGGQTDIAAKV